MDDRKLEGSEHREVAVPLTVVRPAPDFRADNVIDLRVVLRAWLRFWWVFILLALIGAYFGVQDMRSRTPVYTARMTVLPESGIGSVGQALGQLGSALGVNIQNQQTNPNFERLQAVVGSISLATELQRKYGLMQVIFAGSWDKNTQSWIRPTGDEFERRERMRAFFNLPAWRPPDIEALATYLGGAIDFTRKQSPSTLVDVTLQHADSQFALQLLDLVYREADNLLRTQDLAEVRSRRQYIEGQLAAATNLDARQALISLLASEQRRAMLLESDLPYAARIIQPPYASNAFVERNIVLGILTYVIGALGIGALAITAFAVFRNE